MFGIYHKFIRKFYLDTMLNIYMPCKLLSFYKDIAPILIFTIFQKLHVVQEFKVFA